MPEMVWRFNSSLAHKIIKTMDKYNFGGLTNPFELGTNEKNQAVTNNSNFGSFLGDYLQGVKNPMAFGRNGESFLTFLRPPNEFIEKESIKILQEASTAEVAPIVPIKIYEAELEEIESKQESGGLLNPIFGTIKALFNPIIKIIPSFFKASFQVGSAWGSIFTEGFLGAGEKKPKTKQEIEEEKKEAKKTENKKIYWQKLAELTRPAPITGAVKQEMVITNQLNGFYEEYKGVIDTSANINAYHRANRDRKEIENKALQIQQQRAAKMQQPSKKGAGFGKREGELLMGAENPSHFTKALG